MAPVYRRRHFIRDLSLAGTSMLLSPGLAGANGFFKGRPGNKVVLGFMGNIAYRTGRVLKCDPSNGHILNDTEAMKLWNREYEKGWAPKI